MYGIQNVDVPANYGKTAEIKLYYTDLASCVPQMEFLSHETTLYEFRGIVLTIPG